MFAIRDISTVFLLQSIDTFNMTTMGTSVSMMVATAVAFGFGITVLMYAIGHISGKFVIGHDRNLFFSNNDPKLTFLFHYDIQVVTSTLLSLLLSSSSERLMP